MEKKVFLLLIALIGAYSLSTYSSSADKGDWIWQFNNVDGGSNVGLVTYALTDDPRCKAACKKGQFCRISATGVATCKPYCGDGIVAVGQQTTGKCDDGNQNPFDGCNKCKVTPGWFCGNKKNQPNDATGVAGAISVCSLACGDRQLDTDLGESCDDGNIVPGDGCDPKCRTVASWTCTDVDKQLSTCTPKCGDGKRVGDELKSTNCDDGNTDNNDGCSSTCQVEKHWACYGVPSICTYSCGNGVVNQHAKEECDNGIKFKADGQTVIEDGCWEQEPEGGDSAKNCIAQEGWTCTAASLSYNKPSVCKPICGDGMVKGTQQCDDENNINGDGCNSVCNVQVGWDCSVTPCVQKCGDGIRVGAQLYPRRCDDGGVTAGDGCDAQCNTQNLYTCVSQNGNNTPSKCQKLCGNSRWNPMVGEQCDNGPSAVEDGCSNDCVVTAGWTCTGEQYAKSVCTKDAPTPA